MNKVEQLVYNLVKNNPAVKRRIVETYQGILSVVPKRNIETKYNITVREKYFFGFHDKCPWSVDNRMLLAHHFEIPYKITEPYDLVDVGYFINDSFFRIGQTRAWSWQMGSMLQWIGATTNIVYNDYDGKKLLAKVVDAKGGFIKILESPVAAVSPDGTRALSYNFRRFETGLPGYGYVNGIDPDEDKAISSTKGEGLIVLDIASGTATELFSVSDIAELQPHPSMTDSLNFFSHCLFSPSGKRFLFFHRWLERGSRLWTRMFTCNLEGKELFMFPTSGMVSHVAWRDDQHILAYARTRDHGDRYYLFTDKVGYFDIIGEDVFSSDGHPQFSPDKKYILTDTYPDRFRIQNLIVYNIEKNKRYDLARFRLPREFSRELQVDLHPRWNRDGSMICFDCGYTGERSLCTMEVDLDLLE